MFAFRRVVVDRGRVLEGAAFMGLDPGFRGVEGKSESCIGGEEPRSSRLRDS